MLSVQSVDKRFTPEGPWVLEELDLRVGQGEFVSLLGPSGCGKTTLLKIVAGLLPPTGGTVLLEGKESRGPSREKAMVFQHFNLLPWRTAITNVAYGLEVQGMPKAERLEKAAQYLRLLDLEGFENHYPSQISGGMKQRVINPDVLLLDEPFGALDALTREYLQDELARIAASQRLTVLFVTHSIDEAIYLSDRIVVMGKDPGRVLVEYEVPFERPRSSTEVRADPRFPELRNKVWLLLEEEIGKR